MGGSVVILGGGIAGLTAAADLLPLGWRVTILEAKQRLVEDTLFFAGEATVMDAQMGTVFGAIESARRAGNELREMHSAPCPG